MLHQLNPQSEMGEIPLTSGELPSATGEPPKIKVTTFR